MPTMLAPVRRETYRSLLLLPPAAAHAVSWSWLADGTFAGWYVNLETPARRWSGGVDSRDQTLDLLVAPDLSWRLKDEEDLDPVEAPAVRVEAARLAGLAVTAAFPFDGTWRDYVPPPEWPPAALPSWWDAVPR
jgi:predicted RNA-binding protein associated with RNAse of E/G family